MITQDYFDSSYYFGADAGIFGNEFQKPELTFRHELSGLTFFQRDDASGYERLSAYRFHNRDPLVFNGGGKLLWWVGQCKPFNSEDGNVDDGHQAEGGRVTKCGNPFPPTLENNELMTPPPRPLGRALTPINVTTYGWYFTW